MDGLTAPRPDRGRDGVDAWSASVLDSLSWLFSCALAFAWYGAPLAALYLKRDGRIAATIMLLRGSDAPEFDAAAVRLLHRLQPLVEDAFELAAEPPATEPAATTLVAELTTRQAEIAQLVAGGARNAEIAGALDVSEVTVKTHLTKVYAKLGVRSRTQLAVAMGDVG